MKNILLPTDFSENSWNAIEYAIKLFETSLCSFYILHVNKPNHITTDDIPYYIPTDDIVEEVYTLPAKQQLRKILKRISKHFPQNKNHKFYTLTDYNFFIDSIRKHVDNKNIDCIVMGTKGISGFGRHILGTNTGDVITKVKCLTLAIPENAQFVKLKEIAFPTDFLLSYDINILEPISEFLTKYKAAIRIVHITGKKRELNTVQKENKEILKDYFNPYPQSLHYLTNNKIEDALQCFVESRNINMICMVAKNLNYFQQILFHSKAEELSYHTEVPFLVIHE